MTDWIATDLDSTLFHRSWNEPDAVPATWHPSPEDGYRRPSSWMRGGTFRMLESLGRSFALVPVTARDIGSFSRVRVAGLQLAGPAVITNGAVILDSKGNPDALWEQRMAEVLSHWEVELKQLCEWLITRSVGKARPRLVMGPANLPAYLVAKADDGWLTSPEGRVILDAHDWSGCHVAVLGKELQVLPPGVGKREAVAEVRDLFFSGMPPIMCLGDMPQDLDFMRLGTLMATPLGSDLEQSLK